MQQMLVEGSQSNSRPLYRRLYRHLGCLRGICQEIIAGCRIGISGMRKEPLCPIIVPLQRSLGIEQQEVCSSPYRGSRQIIGIGLTEVLRQHRTSIAMHRDLRRIAEAHRLQLRMGKLVDTRLIHLHLDPFSLRQHGVYRITIRLRTQGHTQERADTCDNNPYLFSHLT